MPVVHPDTVTVVVNYRLESVVSGLHQVDLVFAHDEWAMMSQTHRRETCEELIADLLADKICIESMGEKFFPDDDDDEDEDELFEFRI